MVIKELLQKLEGKAPLVKRAPRMLSAFMGPMEDVQVLWSEAGELALIAR